MKHNLIVCSSMCVWIGNSWCSINGVWLLNDYGMLFVLLRNIPKRFRRIMVFDALKLLYNSCILLRNYALITKVWNNLGSHLCMWKYSSFLKWSD